MTTITRRSALSGMAALPVLAAGAPAVAARGDDAELLAAAERFADIYQEHLAIEREHKAFRASVEADLPMPYHDDYPSYEGAQAAHMRWQEQMQERGVWTSSDRWNASSEAAGEAAKAVFAIPAATVAGVLVKMDILRLARGESNDPDDADDALDGYDSGPRGGQVPWIDVVLADLHRIAGRAGA